MIQKLCQSDNSTSASVGTSNTFPLMWTLPAASASVRLSVRAPICKKSGSSMSTVISGVGVDPWLTVNCCRSPTQLFVLSTASADRIFNWNTPAWRSPLGSTVATRARTLSMTWSMVVGTVIFTVCWCQNKWHKTTKPKFFKKKKTEVIDWCWGMQLLPLVPTHKNRMRVECVTNKFLFFCIATPNRR